MNRFPHHFSNPTSSNIYRKCALVFHKSFDDELIPMLETGVWSQPIFYRWLFNVLEINYKTSLEKNIIADKPTKHNEEWFNEMKFLMGPYLRSTMAIKEFSWHEWEQLTLDCMLKLKLIWLIFPSLIIVSWYVRVYLELWMPVGHVIDDDTNATTRTCHWVVLERIHCARFSTCSLADWERRDRLIWQLLM